MSLPQQLVELELDRLAAVLEPDVPQLRRRDIKRFLRTHPWVLDHFEMWERFIRGCK